MSTTEKKIGKKTYVIDEEVSRIGELVQKEEAMYLDSNIGEINITFMKVFPNISPTIAGRCVRSSKLLKFFSDSDIVIEVSGELWDTLDDSVRKILMLHELKHIAVNYKKDGSKVVGLVNHDVQDFYDIIKKYGIDWLTTIKSSIANINKFEKGEEERTRL